MKMAVLWIGKYEETSSRRAGGMASGVLASWISSLSGIIFLPARGWKCSQITSELTLPARRPEEDWPDFGMVVHEKDNFIDNIPRR